MASPNWIGALAFALALPFGFTLLPLMRSDLGAGVCAADFGPGLFMRKFVGRNKDILFYL